MSESPGRPVRRLLDECPVERQVNLNKIKVLVMKNQFKSNHFRCSNLRGLLEQLSVILRFQGLSHLCILSPHKIVSCLASRSPHEDPEQAIMLAQFYQMILRKCTQGSLSFWQGFWNVCEFNFLIDLYHLKYFMSFIKDDYSWFSNINRQTKFVYSFSLIKRNLVRLKQVVTYSSNFLFAQSVKQVLGRTSKIKFLLIEDTSVWTFLNNFRTHFSVK